MFRLRIPQLIYNSDQIIISPKDDDDQMMGVKETKPVNGKKEELKALSKGASQQIKADVNWNLYFKEFNQVPREMLESAMVKRLLQTNSSVSPSLLKSYADAGSRENYIKSITIQLMSTPEYQLC